MDTMVDESGNDKQCIWCGNTTGSDSKKALCVDCVAIPDRIRSLEIRFQERFGCASNSEIIHDLQSNSNEPKRNPTKRTKRQLNDVLV